MSRKKEQKRYLDKEQKHYMDIIQERIQSLKEMLEELFCLQN